MGSVNLDTYSLSLLAAKEDILSGRCSTNWAIFTYEKRNDLKLLDSGAGGLEELAQKFTDTRLLYALCQVKDPSTGHSRVVLINWIGEKVDESYRQTCAAHLPAIKAFFKEASVIISAHRTEEVMPSAIHNALSNLTSATSTSRKPRLIDSEELVGTNYRKTNPALEMRRSKRDSFWAQAEREEEERKEEERRRLQEQRKRWDRERMEQEKKEAEERERKIHEKEQMIEEQRKEQARLQAEERRKEKSKWEQQQKEHEEEMRDRFRRSESIEKAAEAAVLVSQRSLNPREFFRQRENSVSSSSSLSPTSPTPGGTRRPALRYQRSLTESSFMSRKPESPISPSPSPSYARRHDFFSSTSPRTPPETCSPSMIFSKAGAPTRGGRFPIASPSRAGAQPPKPFLRADSMPAASQTQTVSLRHSSPPNIRGLSPTSLPISQPVSPLSSSKSEALNHVNPGRMNSLSHTSLARDESKPPTSPPSAESTPPVSLLKDEFRCLGSLPDHESPGLSSSSTADFLSLTNSVKDESLQPSISPSTASPPPTIPFPVHSVAAFTSDRADSSSIATSTKYESLLNDPTPRAEAAMAASPPRAVPPAPSVTSEMESVSSSTLTSAEFQCPAIITRCKPTPDAAPCIEPLQPASPPRAASPPAVIPPEDESILLVASNAVEFQSPAVTARCEPMFDLVSPYTEPLLPANPLRAVSPPLFIAPVLDPMLSFTSIREESPATTIASKYESFLDDVALPVSPPRSVSPPSIIPPAEESILPVTLNTVEFHSSAILTRCDPIPEHAAPCAEPLLPANPPRAVSPPPAIPLTEQSVQSFTSITEEAVPVVITAGYESLLDDVTSAAFPDRAESPPLRLPSSMPLVHSLTSRTTQFHSLALSTGCDANSDDITLEAKSLQTPSPPRLASPPLVIPPTAESVPGLTPETAESPLSAICSIDEPIPSDNTRSREPALSDSPPRHSSPVLVTMGTETQLSSLSITNEELVPPEAPLGEESVVVEYQDIISESKTVHVASEEPILRSESLAVSLPTMIVDGVAISQVHVSFTDDACQREYVVSKDTSSTVDIDSVSLHTLTNYTPLEIEIETSNPFQSTDLAVASIYSHGKDQHADAEAPLACQDSSVTHADAPYTLEEIRVNGARLNGIGGREEEEVRQQEVMQEEEEEDHQMGPESTPKACTRAAYEYHTEDDSRLFLDGGSLIPQLGTQNEA